MGERKVEYDLWWALASEKAGIKSMQIINQVGGDSECLYRMNKEELMKLKGLNERSADYIIYRRNTWNYEAEWQKLMKSHIRFIPWHDECYPKRLLHTGHHPFALFVLGKLPEEEKPAVAVIGARECSEYGRLCANYFGKELSLAGVNVLSGMAIGIDGIAQQAALEAGGSSYGVLGCGPDVCYPMANRKLYAMLCNKGGVISEYGPHVPAASWHFPIRNRILAGLSDIVLVVEAKAKSGTLITVDMALDAGRDIMIIPGRITDAMSVGCIRLWQSGALVATNVEDVLDVLRAKGFSLSKDGHSSRNVLEQEKKLPLESTEELVYSGFDLYEKSATEVMEQTKLPYQEFVKALTKLELNGMLRETGRGYYVRDSGG